jgi:adenylate kinase
MVKAKLNEPEVKAKGWLLDGFPRTAAQAKAMADIGIKADAFVQLEVPDSVLVERICLRRTDPVTGKIYHLKFNPPPADVVSRLVQSLRLLRNKTETKLNHHQVHRSDDNEESLRERLKQYHSNVEAIKKFYEDIKVRLRTGLSYTHVSVNNGLFIR